MKRLDRTGSLLLTLVLLLPAFSIALFAQEYQPSRGQEGKDVIWIPTPEALVSAMLDMAGLKTDDYLIDLGSGDGRIVIAAAKRGVRALGIEFNPEMVEFSRGVARREGAIEKATFLCADIFEADFHEATVLTLYLLPHLNLRLRPKILEMTPGTRVVSHAFTMGEWEADNTVSLEERTAYLWIVPAKAEGTWVSHSAGDVETLSLKQSFQRIEGTFEGKGQVMPLRNAKLEGSRISFSIGANGVSTREYSGRIEGNSIVGRVQIAGQSEVSWKAQRLMNGPSSGPAPGIALPTPPFSREELLGASPRPPEIPGHWPEF